MIARSVLIGSMFGAMTVSNGSMVGMPSDEVTRSLAATTDQCSRSERNVLVLMGGLQTLLARCLTVNGQADTDVSACVQRETGVSMGLTVLNYGCFTCLVDAVEAINSISLKSRRDACIADVTSDACGVSTGDVDLSSFVTCTGGYDPLQPVVESYCSKDNASAFVQTSMYRQITSGCLDRSNFAASDSTDYVDCIAKTIANSGGHFNSTTLGAECILCWYQLLSGMSILPSEQRDACVADPTSTTCVAGAMHKDLYLFYKCSGFHPVATDKLYLSTTLSNGAMNMLSAFPIAILIAVVTLL